MLSVPETQKILRWLGLNYFLISFDKKVWLRLPKKKILFFGITYIIFWKTVTFFIILKPYYKIRKRKVNKNNCTSKICRRNIYLAQKCFNPRIIFPKYAHVFSVYFYKNHSVFTSREVREQRSWKFEKSRKKSIVVFKIYTFKFKGIMDRKIEEW